MRLVPVGLARLARIVRLVGCLLVPATAAARGAAPAGRSAGAPVLVLGVTVNGKQDPRVQRGLTEHVARSGARVLRAPVSPQDRACSSADCLLSLAQREHADAVLGAIIDEQPQQFGRSFGITVWMYDAVKRRAQSRRTMCPDCLPETLVLRVAQSAVALLRERAQEPGPPSPPRPQAPPPRRAAVPPPGPRRL